MFKSNHLHKPGDLKKIHISWDEINTNLSHTHIFVHRRYSKETDEYHKYFQMRGENDNS